MELRPWAKLLEVLPPLSEKEFNELKASIEKHGIKYPIKVLPDGRIIDGYHRWKILGDKTPYEIVDLPDDEAFELGIILNTARRQLTPAQVEEVYEKAKALALKLRQQGKTQKEVAELLNVSQPVISKWEKEAKSSTGNEVVTNITRNISYQPTEETQKEQQNTPQEKAEPQIEQVKIPDLRIVIPKSEYPKIYERIKNGESIRQIAADYKTSHVAIIKIVKNYEKILEREREIAELKAKAQSLPPPERKYDVVVVDPPWPYGTQYKYDPEKNRSATPYPEMSLDEIKAIRLPLRENAVVFLWTTSQFLPSAFEVLKAWGLEYWFIITWVKTRFVLGRILRHQAEFVVVGKRGSPSFVPQGTKSDVIFAPPGEHSEKPEAFYELIDALFPNALKLDYFARKKREGWDAFGTLEKESK